jgi:hypothetical protein
MQEPSHRCSKCGEREASVSCFVFPSVNAVAERSWFTVRGTGNE